MCWNWKSDDSNGSAASNLSTLQIAYAQKYWDIANSVVTLMYAQNFAIYYLLVTEPKALELLDKHWKFLALIMSVGTAAVAYLIYRLFYNENAIVENAVASSKSMRDAVNSGFHLREMAIFINYASLMAVIAYAINT